MIEAVPQNQGEAPKTGIIEIFQEDDEKTPTQTIPFTFPSPEGSSNTIQAVQIYNLVAERVFNADDDSQDDLDSTMYVYLSEGDIWMNCGIVPPQDEVRLWVRDFEDGVIKVKFGTVGLGKRGFEELSDNDGEKSTIGESRMKRKKYKTIKDVIEVVLTWKKYKKGIRNHLGEVVKFTPKESAEILGVSYKTLYDYMFFLK